MTRGTPIRLMQGDTEGWVLSLAAGLRLYWLAASWGWVVVII